MSSDTLAWLRWVLVPNLGLKRSQTLLNVIDSPQSLFLHPDRWPLPDSVKATLREMNLLGEQHPVHRRALDQLRWAEANLNRIVVFNDDDYPQNLSLIEDAPLVLWTRGKVATLKDRQIAIVGSRHASPNALRHTRQLSKQLAKQGLTVTSGGAKGIDSACHESALEYGSTLAVLGCGVDVVYPKANRALFNNIAQNGLIISEYPLGTQPRPGHFPRRNRIISALAEAVVVIEAALKSGSLVTAKHALDQGKDIFAMPGDIDNPNSEGCHQLIRDGAYLLTEVDDILHHLNWGHETAASQSDPYEQLPPLHQKIIAQLKLGVVPMDVLSHHLGVSAHQLLEPILELELDSLIEQMPGGYTLCDIA